MHFNLKSKNKGNYLSSSLHIKMVLIIPQITGYYIISDHLNYIKE